MRNRDQVRIGCPYCGEEIDVQIDIVRDDEEYMEDCAVCCRPILLHVARDENGWPLVSATRNPSERRWPRSRAGGAIGVRNQKHRSINGEPMTTIDSLEQFLRFQLQAWGRRTKSRRAAGWTSHRDHAGNRV